MSRAQVGSPLTGVVVERRVKEGDAPPVGLLLADEPTGNLDSGSAAEVFGLFRTFYREFGCAVLLMTHDSRLSQRCDRTVSLVDGKIESDKSAADTT